ncbi:MAG: iron-containing alcohol dehydrogenase [Treponema sp.]|jgi:alcohol dehydrogenase class IV|nr:iron-containing alcohol dehydrogenase [Treponema sp.]
MTDITFNLDPEVILGMDTVNRAGTICKAYGSRVLIAVEQRLYENHTIDRLTTILEDSGIETIVFDAIPAQATAEVATKIASLARGSRCSGIIGFGGLTTQWIARLGAISSGSDLFDILEGKTPEVPFLPYSAIPTTLEDPFLFSSYFIAIDPRDRSVKLIKSPKGLCNAVIIDGTLGESIPEQEVFAFDGLCTALEAYCSRKAGILSDVLLEQAIARYARISAGNAEHVAEDFINAGFFLALGTSVSAPGIGTALAYALNGRFSVAKCRCSTVLLPAIVERLITVRPEKIAKAAALMGMEPGASVADSATLALDAIRRRMEALKVPMSLKEFGLALDRLVPVAEVARNLEFVAFSPWTITTHEVYDMLKLVF